MYKLGIIGIGTIGATYQQSLQQLSDLFAVTAVCDPDPAKQSGLYPGAEYYPHHRDMLRSADIDCVVISTPIDTHTAIARDCLEAGKHVLLEKPASLDTEQLLSLYILAEKKHVVFYVGFHAAFALDLLWYLEHSQELEPDCRPDRIEEIRCLFADPYMESGIMDPKKTHLGGSYVDSGVNALSVCARLLNIAPCRIADHQTRRHENGVVYSSVTRYECEGRTVVIETAWDQGRSHKSTLLKFRNSSRKILLDHTAQQVMLLSRDADSRLLYAQTQYPRLPSQYVGVFRDFAAVLDGAFPCHCRADVLHIHRLLSP